MNISYKFRLYPNRDQEILILKTFGCVRFIYNKMLEDKIEHYKETKNLIKTSPAKYKEEFTWLKEVDAVALCNAQLNLEAAYKRFFNKPDAGFPKFKSKKQSKSSYTTNNTADGTSIRIADSKIRLPKLGFVKLKLHRDIPKNSRIKSVTISKSSSNKYYASILLDIDFKPLSKDLDKSKALGLDYSSSSFYVDSQNNKADYPKFYRNAQDKLAREQRKLSKMIKGSHNYEKQKLKISKIHEHIFNQRNDFIHKLSHELSNSYDIICVEDINLRAISQALHLGKSTLDNSFGRFRTFLEYKLTNQGKKLIKIDKWFPSSKMCRFCGSVNSDLKLSDRTWKCDCGAVLDRDHNAAINILNQGLLLVD